VATSYRHKTPYSLLETGYIIVEGRVGGNKENIQKNEGKRIKMTD
jgi:hypothetical protein